MGLVRRGDDEYDNWMSLVAPMETPEVAITAWTQGPGQGANSASGVASDGLRWYLDHRAEVLAVGPAGG